MTTKPKQKLLGVPLPREVEKELIREAEIRALPKGTLGRVLIMEGLERSRKDREVKPDQSREAVA